MLLMIKKVGRILFSKVAYNGLVIEAGGNLANGIDGWLQTEIISS